MFEEGVERRAEGGQSGHGAGEIFSGELRCDLGLDGFKGGEEGGFLGEGCAFHRAGVWAILLVLDAQDVLRALVGGEEGGAGFGFDEGAQGVGAGKDADDVVIVADGGADDVGAGALSAKLDAEAVEDKI